MSKLLCILLSALAAHAAFLGPTGTRDYADGVNPPAHQRKENPGKMVWAYVGPATQGQFGEVYHNVHGMNETGVDVEDLLNTPVNQISFIANVHIQQNATGWFKPGDNNTKGCGQYQTFELPFGFDGTNKSTVAATTPKFVSNIKKLHETGMTITLTLGSWCTELPHKEWTDEQFGEFVDYFETVRSEYFGGYLDGVDFDWEGYCTTGCLLATCSCDWSDEICGDKTPEELQQGVTWEAVPAGYPAGGKKMTYQCWIMPTKATMQVMAGITHAMKKSGHVVTLVPMSVAMYKGTADTSPKKNGRNEYIEHRKNTFGGEEVDLLDMADGILLQWYSGFDASLCDHSDDPKACTCDNVPDKDYPNTIHSNVTGGIVLPWQTYWNISGNSFPSELPVRCQACGKNVWLPDGTRGDLPCVPKGEDWYVPAKNRTKDGANPPDVIADHNNHYEKAMAMSKDSTDKPHWRVKGSTTGSKCPRGIDCPDWKYKGEEDYSRQIKLLKSISTVVDLTKVAVGFETLGTDIMVEYESYQDKALPWSTAPIKSHKPPTPYSKMVYYKPCNEDSKNGTKGHKDSKRCGNPLLWQQWGPKFSAKDIVGLEKAVVAKITEGLGKGKGLAGVGMFTVDGVLAQPDSKKKRLWFDELVKLNETYKIPCFGKNCGSSGGSDTYAPTPAPSGGKKGSYTVKAGDTCYKIADSLCDDGSSWQDNICNSDSVCKALQAGASIKYDCNGQCAN